MIYKNLPSSWKDLEQKIADIFTDVGCSDVEVEKKITGVRGKSEIDVCARSKNSFYICECKNWNKAVPKSVVQTFRTILEDIGASHGFIISRRGFQSGAYSSAKNTNIILVDWYKFQEKFEDSWLESVSRYLYKFVTPLFKYTDTLVPRSITDPLSESETEYYWKLYSEFINIWGMADDMARPFLMPVFDKHEAAKIVKREITFPLELKIPMTTKKIVITDFNVYREYIIKYATEGLSKFRELTQSNFKRDA